VAAFLAAETGNGTKPSTLGRRVAAIRYAHKLAHLDTPTDSEAVDSPSPMVGHERPRSRG
jgi:hypothetical protein